MVKQVNMKKIINYLIIFMALVLVSCEEDDSRGQFPVDETPPGTVSDVQVLNEPGLSVITYVPPTDADLLYVQAKYLNDLGKEAIVRGSSFTNTIELPGFSKQRKVNVVITAVDKSQNIGNPVTTEIEPLDNPIHDILQSIEWWEVFGGVKLKWTNEEEQEVVIEFLRENTVTNSFEFYENIYTQAQSLEQAVRGLEAKETNFGYLVRDKYGLRTDTVSFTATPYFEEQVSSSAVRQLSHPSHFSFPYSDSFSVLWDGNTAKQSYSIKNNEGGPVWFTMDFNEPIKYSRFTMWCRPDFVYAHSQPRHIKLLGTNDPTVANDPDSEEGWEVIGEWIDQKPSGGDASDAPTEEDKLYFSSGMEFETDINAGFYQYVRFVSVESWGDTDRMWLGELRFWGQKKSMNNEE
jgi:hypothetical protein